MLYSWKPEDALKMPASRFFAMLRSGREIRATERVAGMLDLCEVSSIALGNSKYYTVVRNGFRDRLNMLLGVSVKPTEYVPNIPAVDSGSPAAFRAMSHMFSQAKRFA